MKVFLRNRRSGRKPLILHLYEEEKFKCRERVPATLLELHTFEVRQQSKLKDTKCRIEPGNFQLVVDDSRSTIDHSI